MNESTARQSRYVGAKEQAAFYFSAMLRDMSYSIMGFLTYFYIDVMGLSGAALSLVIVGGRLWDGINDPIIGAFIDRSVTEKGKARPIFKRTAVPVAILIIVIFYSPKFSVNAALDMWLKAVYALSAYALFEALHTMNGTAFMSMYNSITPNTAEKNKVISVSRLFSSMGTGIVAGAVPIALSFFANDDIMAKTYIYLFTAVFVSVCFLIYNFLMVRFVKERIIHVPEKKQDLKLMLKVFFKNKLLLLMMLSNMIAGLLHAGQTSIWFFTYNMGNPAYATYGYILGVPFLILGTVLMPVLAKRFEKNVLVLACSAAQLLITAVYLILGYGSLAVVLGVIMVGLLPSAMKMGLYWSMVSDSIDYLEWKTGLRNDGMALAIEGFLAKCIGAIGALSTVIIIKIIDYVPNAPAQSEKTMRGLFYVPQLITLASTALSSIPYFFYKFTREDHAGALAEIKQRSQSGSAGETA